MTFGAPVGCFVAFVLSLICLVEILVLPWLRNRNMRRDARIFMKPDSVQIPRRYPASGEGV